MPLNRPTNSLPSPFADTRQRVLGDNLPSPYADIREHQALQGLQDFGSLAPPTPTATSNTATSHTYTTPPAEWGSLIPHWKSLEPHGIIGMNGPLEDPTAPLTGLKKARL